LKARFIPVHTAAAVLLALAAAAPPASAAPTTAEQAIIDAIDATLESQRRLLEAAVNINSGTRNLDGVKKVGKLFRRRFDDLGFQTEWLKMPRAMKRAGHLLARHPGKRGRKLLLLGHLDTVFPKDSPFQRYTQKGDMAFGPGISDMKSGDTIIVFALNALKTAGVLEGMRITVMLTGDEEMAGKPLSKSRGPLIALGKEADAALSFEGGAIDAVTTVRRGSSNWRLEVSGKRAHSSAIFRDGVGAGAIFEAARILNRFYNQVRGERYLTFNPGIILGGTDIDADFGHSRGAAFGKTNVIASRVVVRGGLRFISAEQKERARAKMRDIVAESLPETAALIRFEDRYPAMSPSPANRALFEVMKGINADLSYAEPKEVDPALRGAGDISFVAPYVASIDGLGADGEGAHTTDEKLDLASLAPMTKRAALLIYRLTRQDK